MFMTVIVTLLVLGLVLYLINRYAPIDPEFKNLIRWVFIIGAVIWLLKVFGIMKYLANFNPSCS